MKVMNQFTPRHSVDTMTRLSNEDMADIHMSNGSASGNARSAARLYQEPFPNRYLPGHRMLANLHGSFNEKMRGLGRCRELRDAVEEDVMQYFRDNPRAIKHPSCSTWLRITKRHRRRACSHGQPSTSILFSESARPATNYLLREQFARWCLSHEQDDDLFFKVCSLHRRSLFHTHRNVQPA